MALEVVRVVHDGDRGDRRGKGDGRDMGQHVPPDHVNNRFARHEPLVLRELQDAHEDVRDQREVDPSRKHLLDRRFDPAYLVVASVSRAVDVGAGIRCSRRGRSA